MITTIGRVGRPVWRAGHLAPALDPPHPPHQPHAAGVLCGALLIRPADSAAIPCAHCLAISRSPRAWVRPTESPTTQPAQREAVSASPEELAGWGWPILRWGDRTTLLLGHHLIAVLLPADLAHHTQQTLTQQDRPTPVLVHPHHPQHRILLTQEPFGAPLPWPPHTLPITGCLPTPPHPPHAHAPTWEHLPDTHPQTHAREIDLWSALRALTTGQPHPGEHQ